jgi:hypothetical protein
MHSPQTETTPAHRKSPIRVTFDTNTLSGVVDPDQRADEADHAAYQEVHAAVRTGQIRGFFSEVVVTVDAIGRKAKAEVLGAARFVSETTSTGPNNISISLGPCWKRVDIDPQILARVQTAREIGMRALIGPRRFGDSFVAQGFGEGFYEPYPSGAAFIAAAETTNALDAAIGVSDGRKQSNSPNTLVNATAPAANGGRKAWSGASAPLNARKCAAPPMNGAMAKPWLLTPVTETTCFVRKTAAASSARSRSFIPPIAPGCRKRTV